MNKQPQILIQHWPDDRDFPVRLDYTPVRDNQAGDHTPAVHLSFSLSGEDIVRLLIAAESSHASQRVVIRTGEGAVLLYSRYTREITINVDNDSVAEVTLPARATERLIDKLRNAWIAGRDDLDEVSA